MEQKLERAEAVFRIDRSQSCTVSEHSVILVVRSEARWIRYLAEQAECRPAEDGVQGGELWCCPDRHEYQPAWITRTAGGPTCEAALAEYSSRQANARAAGTAASDPTQGLYGAILNRGDYLGSCEVPDTMQVDICAAVHGGTVVGVTVITKPPTVRIGDCVAAAARALSFPSNPSLDVTRTKF